MESIARAIAAVKLLTRIRLERPDLWDRIVAAVKEFTESYQPEPFTPKATVWHNEALRMAREKLGRGADLSEVLQEAARIQQAGKAERAEA